MAKKPYHDPGLVPGTVAVLVVLLFWLLVTLRIGADDSESEAPPPGTPAPAMSAAPKPPPTVVRPAPARPPSSAVTSVPAQLRSDQEWNQAVLLGDGAIEELAKAMEEQERKGGLNLHAYQEEARRKLEESLGLLDELVNRFPATSPEGRAIARKRRQYEKELGYTRK